MAYTLTQAAILRIAAVTLLTSPVILGEAAATGSPLAQPPAATADDIRISADVVKACLNKNDGRITLTVEGGTPPYTYDWFGADSQTNVLADVAPGRQPVTVTDAAGQERSLLVGVGQERSVNVRAQRRRFSTCEPAGAASAISYTSQVDLATVITNGVEEPIGPGQTWDFADRADGRQNLKLYDVNGCYQNNDFLVYSFGGSKNVIQVSVSGSLCSGGRFAFAPFEDACGTHTYTWPDGTTTTGTTGKTITVTESRSYPVRVTNDRGQSVTVDMDISNVSLGIDAAVAEETPATAPLLSDGRFAVDVATALGPGQFYLFRDGVIVDAGDGPRLVDAQAPSGKHTYLVTNGFACEGVTFEADLSAPPCPLDISRSYVAVDLCTDNSGGVVVAEVEGGAPPYEFRLRDPEGYASGRAGVTEATYEFTDLFTGPHRLTVTDAAGCVGTRDVPLGANPPAPACTPLEADPDGTGGAIDLAISGGSPPYAIFLDGTELPSGNAEQRISGLDEGTYDITVRDDAGCTSSCTAVVEARVDPCYDFAASARASGLRCYADGPDGRVDVELTAGTAPFDYAWDHAPDLDGPVATGLPGDRTYTVTVTDGNTCTATASVPLTRPTPFTQSLTRRNASGVNASDGEIRVTLGGGTPPYTVTVAEAGGAEITSYDVDAQFDYLDLAPGTYSLDARDSRGCAFLDFADVVVEPGRCLDFDLAIVDSLNPGCRADGRLRAEARGGTPPYAYAWDDGVAGPERTGLTAGTYAVTATDAEGCTQTVAHAFRPTPPVIACASPPGDSAVHVTASQGLLPLAYEVRATGVDGEGYAYRGSSETLEFSVAVAVSGEYRVTVTGARGCVDACATEVTPCVRDLGDLPVAAVANDLICGAADGRLDFSATDASFLLDAYETSVDGGTTWSDALRYADLPAGTYAPALRARDYRQCVYYGDALEIRRNPAALATLAPVTPPSGCGGADGAVEIDVPTGAAGADDLRYTLVGGYALAGVTQDSGRFPGLTAGAYRLAVEHLPSGCTRELTAAVADEAQPTVTGAVATDSDDCMDFNGTVAIAGQRFGGNTRFGVSPIATPLIGADDPSWGTETTITGLAPGRYFARVRDEVTGCSYFWPDTLVVAGQRPPYLAGVDVSAASTCLAPDGRVALRADERRADSLDHVDLRYTFDGGETWQADAARDDLKAGSYRIGLLTLADPGCVTWDTAVVADGFRVSLDTVTRVRPWGCTLDNGVIAFVDSAGADQRFSIDGGASWQAEPRFGDLRAGTFSLTVAPYDLGCPVAVDTLVLRDRPLPPLDIDTRAADALGCFADDGTITLPELEDGVRYEVYAADRDQPIRNWPNLFREWWGRRPDSLHYGRLRRGDYVVTAVDRTFACRTDTVELALFGYDTLVLRTDLAAAPTCYLDRDGLAFVSARGGDGDYRYAWADGPTGPERPDLPAGDYAVRLTDARGCADSAAFAFPHPPAYAAIDSIVGDLDQCGSREVWYDLGYLADTLDIAWGLPDGSGVTGPDLVSTQSGRHTVTVTSPDGCGYVEDFDVALADTTQPTLDLLVASAYQRQRGGLEVFEISDVAPDEVTWVIDDPRITVLDSAERVLSLAFAEPGTYTVGMRGRFGECSAQARRTFEVTDDVILDREIVAGVGIRAAKLYPNPHRGVFSVDVELNEVRNVTIELVDLTTRRTLERRLLRGRRSYRGVRFGTSSILFRGQYVVVVRAGSSVRVINHVKL